MGVPRGSRVRGDTRGGSGVIPLSTTLISVHRAVGDPPESEERDPYDTAAATEVVHSGVRAVISSPSGRERNVGGAQEVVEFSLSCDPIELRNTDQVEDLQTETLYEVVWSVLRGGFGLEHTRAGLRKVTGLA